MTKYIFVPKNSSNESMKSLSRLVGDKIINEDSLKSLSRRFINATLRQQYYLTEKERLTDLAPVTNNPAKVQALLVKVEKRIELLDLVMERIATITHDVMKSCGHELLEAKYKS